MDLEPVLVQIICSGRLQRWHVSACVALTVLCMLLGSRSPLAADVPKVSSIQSLHGTVRSLVVLEGSGLEKARVIWDAGLPTERKLAPSFQGATMFSVPPNSAPGGHPLAIESSQGRSAVLRFTVDSDKPNATPRLDQVTLANATFEKDGNVRVNLYVQGANLDVGAKVLIDGAETDSSAHKAINNNLFGANPATLGYPIRHYLSHIVSEISRPCGTTVSVKLTNEAGESSNEIRYALPTDAKTISSAGDGIPDEAKRNGYDNGHGRIDLKALGADPYRKIIFVQVDMMPRATKPIPKIGGSPGTFDAVKQMFANAPIINPYGANGIDLVIDDSGTVPDWRYLDFVDQDDPRTGTGSFWKMKNDRLDPKRVGLYHYAVWGRERLDNASGYSDVDFNGTKVGEAFMITLGDAPTAYQTVQSQAETFAHELGHDLGQKHGGTNHSRHKPNYWSLMSYTWQLRTSIDDDSRSKYPTCTQIYYATPGAVETNGKLPKVRKARLDYSEGMGPSLVGNNKSLIEKSGVCGQPIDWNRNGKIDTAPVNAQVDDDDGMGAQVADFANWSNLGFSGPKLGGSHSP
ncbi:hypothetical protein [Bradyrhizobium mercantei]|uniref:hypothetical protein n=1 Tax=Bradyrhizobium mercantei TaxID=1904807 RepID=UPI00117825BC|nr:hypothetical protein [Bradyrhizobium mercantei]